MLITHSGISGPCTFYLSRYLPYDLVNGKSKSTGNTYYLNIDFCDGQNSSITDSLLLNLILKNPKKKISNLISSCYGIPNSFVRFILSNLDIDVDIFASGITKSDRKNISQALHCTQIKITETEGFSKAMVTAGGINIKEINPKTMESKLEEGLYFAGEVIDIDGFTGGFNLQAAFSTGYLAGLSAANSILKHLSSLH